MLVGGGVAYGWSSEFEYSRCDIELRSSKALRWRVVKGRSFMARAKRAGDIGKASADIFGDDRVLYCVLGEKLRNDSGATTCKVKEVLLDSCEAQVMELESIKAGCCR